MLALCEGIQYPQQPPIDCITRLAILIRDGVTSGNLLAHLRANAKEVAYTSWIVMGYARRVTVGPPDEEFEPIGDSSEATEATHKLVQALDAITPEDVPQVVSFSASPSTAPIPWIQIALLIAKLLAQVFGDEGS